MAQAKEDAERLLADWDALDGQIASLAPVGLGFHKTRIHGDLHLGQVLLCKDDFAIIDFEGEPIRPLEERRAKHCILKDLAGMLRSFDYAAAASVAERLDLQSQDGPTLARAASDWRSLATSSFLGAYRASVADISSCPPAEDAGKLLQLFLMEKVLYEIAYEGANRPSWVHIPLAGLMRLMGRTA